jgi:hypothetical protein
MHFSRSSLRALAVMAMIGKVAYFGFSRMRAIVS